MYRAVTGKHMVGFSLNSLPIVSSREQLWGAEHRLPHKPALAEGVPVAWLALSWGLMLGTLVSPPYTASCYTSGRISLSFKTNCAVFHRLDGGVVTLWFEAIRGGMSRVEERLNELTNNKKKIK